MAARRRPAASRRSSPPRSSRSHHCCTGSASGTSSTTFGHGVAAVSSCRVSRPTQDDVGVGAPLRRHEPCLVERQHPVGVHDSECRVPPGHEEVGTEVGRECNPSVADASLADDPACLIRHGAGAVPVRLGLYERGPCTPVVEVEQRGRAPDVTIRSRPNALVLGELFQDLRGAGLADIDCTRDGHSRERRIRGDEEPRDRGGSGAPAADDVLGGGRVATTPGYKCSLQKARNTYRKPYCDEVSFVRDLSAVCPRTGRNQAI